MSITNIVHLSHFKSLAKVIMGLAITSLLLCTIPASKGASPALSNLEITIDSLANPFLVKYAGVPFTPSPCGTGLPLHLTREEAIQVIYATFEAEGIPLEKNVVIHKNDLLITADGYSEKYDIGFVWMDWQNYGAGMMEQFPYQSVSQISPFGISDWKHYNRNPEKYLEHRKRFADREFKRQFITFVENQLPKLTRINQEKAFLNALLTMHYEAAIYRNAEFPQPYQTLVITQELEEASIPNLEALHTINCLAYYFTRDNHLKHHTSAIETILTNVLAIGERSKQKDEIQFLIEMQEHVRNSSRVKKEKEISVLFQAMTTSGKERANALKQFKVLVNQRAISLREARELEAAAHENHYFIAPIGQRDGRFSYQAYYTFPKNYRDLRKQLWKATEPTEIKRLKLEIEGIHEQVEKERDRPRLESLQKLEEQVTHYIRWAKSQQGF